MSGTQTTIISSMESAISRQLRDAGGQDSRRERSHSSGAHMFLIAPKVIELPVTERQIEREHLIQLRRWQETRGELECRSPPRMHGAKAILDAEPGPRPALQPSPSIRLPPDAALPSSKTKPHKQAQKEQKRTKTSGQPDKSPGLNQATVVTASGDACPPQDAPPKDPVSQDPAPQDSTPQNLAYHHSQESLTSQESEDTYL